MRSSPELALQFVDLLCERLRTVSAKPRGARVHGAAGAVGEPAAAPRRQDRDGGGGVAISQADLADFAGATREGVAKILAEWRALGWVSLSRGTVRILNRRALDAVAHTAID